MGLNRDDILEALGFQQRTALGDWITPALVGFGVGAAVGAAVALLVAPRAGSELRDELLERGRRAVQRGRERMDELTPGAEGRTEPRH
jgi:hypothetical protein